jgi:hypothetical protein
MRITRVVMLAAFCLLIPRAGRGQVVPFFAGPPTAFDPEISVVNSGEVLDAQAVGSSDMRYVTINARASSSQLLALRDFQFARSNNNGPRLGFVGAAGAGGHGNALDRRGMTLVARLDD